MYDLSTEQRARKKVTNREWQERMRADPVRHAAYKKAIVCWKHGIDVETFDALVFLQDNRCDICGELNPTNVDHDHGHCPGSRGCVKCVRGILCGKCNRGLGLLREKNMQRALEYVERG